MALLRMGRAGVFHDGHEEPAVAAVAHRRFDALVGHDAHDRDVLDAQVAEHVLEVGGVEQARRGLRDDDLVGPRRELVDDFGLPCPLGDEDPRDLVVEAPIAPVEGQGLDDRVDHLHAALPAGGDQAPAVGDHETPDALPQPGVPGLRGALLLVVLAFLHIDDEKHGALGLEAALPERHVTGERDGVDLASFHASSRKRTVTAVPEPAGIRTFPGRRRAPTDAP